MQAHRPSAGIADQCAGSRQRAEFRVVISEHGGGDQAPVQGGNRHGVRPPDRNRLRIDRHEAGFSGVDTTMVQGRRQAQAQQDVLGRQAEIRFQRAIQRPLQHHHIVRVRQDRLRQHEGRGLFEPVRQCVEPCGTFRIKDQIQDDCRPGSHVPAPTVVANKHMGTGHRTSSDEFRHLGNEPHPTRHRSTILLCLWHIGYASISIRQNHSKHAEQNQNKKWGAKL